MINAHYVSTLMERGEFLDQTFSNKLDKNVPYREAIGSLLYLETVSRPDLTFTINYFSQVLEEPTIKHWNMVKRVLRYLRGTTELGILYDSSSDGELEAFSDADYVEDVSTRHSTSGMIFKYCGEAIAWSSLKQRCVAWSTTETEFVCLEQAGYIKDPVCCRAGAGWL
ncbi:hypothetical protein Trydic_g5515 [Trypoxylus dichotomus]